MHENRRSINIPLEKKITFVKFSIAILRLSMTLSNNLNFDILINNDIILKFKEKTTTGWLYD